MQITCLLGEPELVVRHVRAEDDPIQGPHGVRRRVGDGVPPLAPADQIIVRTGAADQAVVTGPSHQRVVAIPADQRVAPRPAIQEIGSRASREQVVQRIPGAVACPPGRQRQIFNPLSQSEVRHGLNRVRPPIGILHDHVAITVHDVGVVSVPADQRVGPGPAIQNIVAGSAVHHVAAAQPHQRVVALRAAEPVGCVEPGDGVVAGNVALGLLLVGLLGSLSSGALDGLGDVVGGVGDGVGGLAEDTLVRLVGVGSRHVDGW